MSGGSFNYLADRVKSGGQWKDSTATLAEMECHLRKVSESAASATARIIELLLEAQEKAEELADVWRAAEWRRSGDCDDEELNAAIAEWFREHENT